MYIITSTSIGKRFHVCRPDHRYFGRFGTIKYVTWPYYIVTLDDGTHAWIHNASVQKVNIDDI